MLRRFAGRPAKHLVERQVLKVRHPCEAGQTVRAHVAALERQILQVLQVPQMGVETAHVALGVNRQVDDAAVFDLEPELVADRPTQLGDRLLLL